MDKIRDIIGPGGKMIRSIVERTGCKIDVEDDGRVSIASVDESAARKAIAIIEELTATPELNKSYLGKVVRVVEFGAFVEILPGTDGLLHVSEMAHHRVNNVHDEVKEGDQVLVKVVSIDPSGKIRLSRKALLEEAEGGTPAEGGPGGGESQRGPGRPPARTAAGHGPSGGTARDRGRRPRRAGWPRRPRARRGPRPGPAALSAVRSGRARRWRWRPRPVPWPPRRPPAGRRPSRSGPRSAASSPPSITLRRGESVEHRPVRRRTREHCFAIDALRIEKRIVPGRTTTLDLTPDRAGVFPFYCCLESGEAAGASAAS